MYIKPVVYEFASEANLFMMQYDLMPGLIFSDFICGGDVQLICGYQGPAEFTVVDCSNGGVSQQSTFNPASFPFSPDPDNPSHGIINQPSDTPLDAVIVDEDGHFTVNSSFPNHPTTQVGGQSENCIADIQITGSGTISPESVTVHFDQTFSNIHPDPNVNRAVCSPTGQTICFAVDFEGVGMPIGQGQGD